MTIRVFLLLFFFSLPACSEPKVDNAELIKPVNPDKTAPAKIKRTKTKTLDLKTRHALNANNPDDLIVVVTESGVTLYGAPGKKFRYEPAAENPAVTSATTTKTSKTTTDKTSTVSATNTVKKKSDKVPVNDVTIKTFINSPECQSFYDGAGGYIWYPADCPK